MVDPEDRLPSSLPRGRGRARAKRSLLVRLLPILIVVVALGGFVGLVGYYYMAAGPNGVAPLIKADQQPFKVKPDNPGGMAVPDQDKEIYDRMGRVDQSSVPPPHTERLLPPPETPLPRPAETAAAPAAAPLSAPPAAPPSAANANPAGANPPAAANPNVGTRVLGSPSSQRATTLAPAPPGGTPAAPPTNVATVVTTPPVNAPARSAPPPPAPAPVKTAAVVPPRPAPAAEKERSGGPLLRAAIASVRSEADARREWERQRRLYPEALSRITPSYASVNLGPKGVYWRIYIGPAEASAAARERCAALKAKKVDCFVARP